MTGIFTGARCAIKNRVRAAATIDAEHLILDAEMRAICLQLSMKPVISTGSFVSGSSHGYASTKAPKGVWNPYKGHSELESLVAKYESAMDNEARKRIIAEAQVELDSWVRSENAHKGEEFTFEEQVIKDGKGHSPEEVGQHFNIDAHYVRRIRKRFKCGTEDGRATDNKAKAAAQDPEARRKTVQELKRRGFPNRRIADILGIAESTIRRDLQAIKFQRPLTSL